MSGDLVSGRYPVTYSFAKAFGLGANTTQGNIPYRTNAEVYGLGGQTDSALAGTGVGCFVPIPVEAGDTISKVSIPIGATAGGVMTHQFVAIYSGVAVPALLGQSTDTTSAAIAASATASWTLSTAVIVTAATAPYGYIYAGICITATTVPTAVSWSTPTATGYQWFTNMPLFQSATAGSALLGTAAATIATPVAKATAPAVFLS